MGYNNENAERLIFDIETAPLPEAVDYLEPADAPANYKDPIKIAEYIATKQAENLDRCGLDVDLCRIVAIGVQAESMDGPLVLRSDDESLMLEVFWQNAERRHLVGFNCIAFDLPVLQRRSMYLNVKTPSIQVDRYRHPQVTDLQQILSYNGTLRLRSLSFYAKRLGFDIEDAHTGADIARLVAEGNWDAVEAHVKADVQKTRQLAARLGFFSQQAVGAL